MNKTETKKLLRISTGFRKGILNNRPSSQYCYMVSAPLQGYLSLIGYETKLTEGEVMGYGHYWLTLPDDSIIDPTADQFKTPDGKNMPPVYIGDRPDWYLVKEE